MNEVHTLSVATPIGLIRCYAGESGLRYLQLPNQPKPIFLDAHIVDKSTTPSNSTSPTSSTALLQMASDQLLEYFAGTRTDFDLPLQFEGTRFQQSVWRALRTIPYGQTICYQALAIKLASPEAVRAVGQANRKNPIPIVVPCHRVIAKNGQLSGYSGGIHVKQALLDLEQAHIF